MYLRLSQKRTRLAPCAQLMVGTLIILFGCSVTSQGQRPSQPLRDMVRAMERKEMDRMLLLKPMPAAKDDSTRRAVLKQIIDDFREMQSVNNRMMADAWARPELDYRSISDAVGLIRSKAVRLKSNLALPEPENHKKKDKDTEISGTKEFRKELLQLDRLIMSFATNPLFQKPDVVEMDLANQASRDLNGIIEQSARVKETATRLKKSPNSLQ